MTITNDVLFQIKNLHAKINGIKILKGLNISIKPGEIHAIMGPNGSGKSTLAKVIAGHPSYVVTEGEIVLGSQSILSLDPATRSHLGIFLAFQYPVEIPGVSNIDFLRLSLNSKRKYDHLEELDPLACFSLINAKLDSINMDSRFLNRNVNEGFSGGEKKKNEILQMALLNTKLAILDETDSGLDIDALKVVSENINKLANKDNGIILITHYQRLLNYVTPNFIHIMQNGSITYTGNAELAKKLEKIGYEFFQPV